MLIPTLLDEETAGKYLGGSETPIPPRSMQRWRLEGIGPTYIKVGRLIRYRPSDLDEYLQQRTCSSHLQEGR